MLRFEIKKIWSKPMNQAAVLLLFVIVIAGSLLAARDVKYYKEDGSSVSGIFAAGKLRSEKNKWKGHVTEEVLKKVVEENRRAHDETDTDDEALVKYQGISDLREWINSGMASRGNYDYYLCDSILPEDAAMLYEKRVSLLKDEFAGQGHSKKEKELLMRRYEEFEAPLYYSYADGWKAVLDSQYLPTLMIITIVIIGFLISGVFSCEFQLGADSVFFSAKNGRGRGIQAKVEACFLVITAVYWAVMLLFSGLVLGMLGFQGAGLMIQTDSLNWTCMYNITFAEKWLLTMFGGYAAHLFILLFALLVSAKSRSVVAAVTIPFALSCAPMFLGRVPMLSRAMNLFPDMLLRISSFLRDNLIYEFGGKVYGVYEMLIPVYLFLALVMMPALYVWYRRSELA